MSGLIGAPISAGIGAIFDAGRTVGVNVINSVQAGMLQGAISYGLSFTGTQSSLIGSLLSRDVTNNLALAIGRDGLFNTVFNILGKTALNVVNVVGGAAKTIFEGVASFSTLIQQKGLAGALESFTTSIFGRSAQEAILQKGGMQTVLANTPRTQTVLANGQSVSELKIDDTASLFFDNESRLIGRKDQGIYELGEFGYNSFGNFDLLVGDVNYDMGNGLDLYAQITDGQAYSIRINAGQEMVFEATPEKNGQAVYIQAPQYQEQNPSSFNFWNATLSLLPYGLNIVLGNGTAYSAQLTTNSPSPVGHSPDQDILYGLVNGIGNKETNPNTPPAYIQNLESDLVTQSGWTLSQGADFVKSAIYQPWQFLHLGSVDLNIAKDIVRVVIEMQAQEWISSIKVMSDFDTRFAYSATDRSRLMVAMGYSGGFVPLVKAIDERKYNTETVVALGAATSLLFGISADARDAILALIQQGSFGFALQAVQLYLKTQESRLPDLSGSSVKRIVNVYGTEDILNQVGIGGKRDNLCGVNTINIEIKDATHFDYMRRSDETDPVKKEFNVKVSDFVTRLTLASNNDKDLNDYLTTTCEKGSDGVWRFIP